MSTKLNSIAVLIDADNASPKNIGYILKKIEEKLGVIRCKKLFGDWSGSHIQGWKDAWLEFAIKPIQQPAYAKGKNATDIGMVIEAMDLLHSHEYDGFCIVSSDSDFTSLALRIREDNIKVFGFGKRNTVIAFTQACDQFFYVEDLVVTANTASPTPPLPKLNQQHAKTHTQMKTKTDITINAKTKDDVGSNTGNSKNIWDSNRLKCDTKLINSLRAAVVNHPKADSQGWVNFGLVGQQLFKLYPNFKPDYYGYQKSSDIVKQIDLFETKSANSSIYVRCKVSTAPKAPIAIDKSKSAAITPVVVASKLEPWNTKKLSTQTHLISVLNKLIKEDNNSINGWSNISPIASRIKQSHENIKLEKYGYNKFSELLEALDLYDIKRQENKILVRLKHKKVTAKVAATKPLKIAQPKPNNSHLETQQGSKLFPAIPITIKVISPINVQPIVFRLTSHQKVRGYKDIVFYNQTRSQDGSVTLTQKGHNDRLTSEFSCFLSPQPANIQQLAFTLLSLEKTIASGSNDFIVQLIIKNNLHDTLLFSGNFRASRMTGQSLELFSLNRIDEKWQFILKKRSIHGDLQYLCQKYGVELSDD